MANSHSPGSPGSSDAPSPCAYATAAPFFPASADPVEAREAAIALSSGPPTAEITKRKSYLLSLVNNLTFDEVWMLQARLSSLDMRTDIFGSLPPELQIMISDYLGPVDLGCCLQVSRTWRACFLRDRVRTTLARRCFPSLLEYAEAAQKKAAASSGGGVSSSSSSKGKPDDDSIFSESSEASRFMDRIFADVARKYAVRTLGRFRVVFHHCRQPVQDVIEGGAGSKTWLQHRRLLSRHERTVMEVAQELRGDPVWPGRSREWPPPLPPLPHVFLDMDNISRGDFETDEQDPPERFFIMECFAYGRLAWQKINDNSTSFLIDNLRTGQRRHIRVARGVVRGDTYLLATLGDELLVATTGIRLIAWDVNTGKRSDTKLSGQIDGVASLGRRVFILSNRSVYVWEVGNCVKQVDTAGIEARHLEPELDGRLQSFFLLDPLNEDVFYLGNYILNTRQGGREGDFWIYIHRFENRRYRESFSSRLPYTNYTFPGGLLETSARRNAWGLYSLASWRISTGYDLNNPRAWTSTQTEGVMSIAFNIYSKKFSRSFFRLPPNAPSFGREPVRMLEIHIWNDQLLTIADRYQDGPGGKILRTKPMLFAYDDELGEEVKCAGPTPFSRAPCYTSKTLSKADGAAGTLTSTEAQELAASLVTQTIPEYRKKVRFREFGENEPGRWQQQDEDWAKTKCLLRYALDIDAQPSWRSPDRPAHIPSYRVQGDDDFIVFHHGLEYHVWSFHDNAFVNYRTDDD